MSSKINSYFSQGIASSVLNSTPVDVFVDSRAKPQPKTKWSKLADNKVWQNDQGFVVENASFVNLGKPVRLFYVYRNYDCYSKGLFFADADKVYDAKIIAENFTPKKESK